MFSLSSKFNYYLFIIFLVILCLVYSIYIPLSLLKTLFNYKYEKTIASVNISSSNFTTGGTKINDLIYDNKFLINKDTQLSNIKIDFTDTNDTGNISISAFASYKPLMYLIFSGDTYMNNIPSVSTGTNPNRPFVSNTFFTNDSDYTIFNIDLSTAKNPSTTNGTSYKTCINLGSFNIDLKSDTVLKPLKVSPNATYKYISAVIGYNDGTNIYLLSSKDNQYFRDRNFNTPIKVNEISFDLVNNPEKIKIDISTIISYVYLVIISIITCVLLYKSTSAGMINFNNLIFKRYKYALNVGIFLFILFSVVGYISALLLILKNYNVNSIMESLGISSVMINYILGFYTFYKLLI